MTRGGLISFMPDGTTVTQTEEVSVDPKIVPEKKIEDLAHAVWNPHYCNLRISNEACLLIDVLVCMLG